MRARPFWSIAARLRAALVARILDTDAWVPMLMIGLPTMTALLFLTLFASGVRENRQFDRDGVDTFGRLAGERYCRTGSRFGWQQCYEIDFTDQDGRTVRFSARGHASYRAGLYVLPALLPVEYLPQRPSRARLRGDRADTGLTGALGFGSLALGTLMAGLVLRARRSGRRHADFRQQLDACIDTAPSDTLYGLAEAVADPASQQSRLQDIALALYTRGRVIEADEALLRALELNRRIGGGYGRDIELAVLGQQLRASGHPTAAGRAFDAITHRDVRRHFGL